MTGRPKGTPKTGGRKKGALNKSTADIKAIAAEHGQEAVNTLVELMKSEDVPPPARVAAAKELLDRGYGKSTQAVDVKAEVENKGLPVFKFVRTDGD